jgi:hypothetical protein
MKLLKTFGLVLVMIASIAVFAAGSASAAGGVLCSTASTPCASKWATPTVMDFSLKSGSSTKITDTSGNTLDTCTTSTLKGQLTANPEAKGTATVQIAELTWAGCTVTTDTVVPGALRFEAEGSGNAVVSADAKIEWTVNVFGSCNFGVEAGTTIGTLKEGIGSSAILVVNAIIRKLNGGFICPETEKMVAEYTLTAPSSTTLYVASS